MIVVTVLWPSSGDARFDEDYYLGTHVPLLQTLFGDKLTRIEVANAYAV